MPLPVTPMNFLAIQTAIYNGLVAELNPAGGRLSAVQAVGEEWLNEVDLFPYVHISFAGFKQDDFATRKRKQTFDFVVGMAVQSSVSLADAKAKMHTYLDDGAGNGLCQILNDPANYTWGGLAHRSEILELKVFDNLGMDKAASPSTFISYAVIRYQVITFSTWQSNPA
jgi:hypothetical protein